MGNNSSNKKTKKKDNYQINQDNKDFENKEEINQNIETNDIVDIESILKNISSKRKQELKDFILSNVTIDEKLIKEKQQQINNENLSFPFVSKFDLSTDFINSYFILISNDIIIVPTNHIYKKNKSSYLFSFSQLKNDIYNDIFHIIIENDDYNKIFF